MTTFLKITPSEAAQLLRAESPVFLVDVREPGEFATERVSSSLNFPLSSFSATIDQVPSAGSMMLLCQMGARAESAADQLIKRGRSGVMVVAGGINAWKAAGLPLEKGSRQVWVMERQVRFAAGLLVLLGVGLSLTVHPGFIGLSAFVGAGLTFSGVTGWCGMALLLAKMPWNTSKGCGVK